MSENTPYTNLKAAIEVLEKQQTEKRQLLQEEFKATYENLNPFNFIKNSFSAVAGSPEIRNNLLSVIIPLVSGILTKRAFAAGNRSNTLKQAGILFLDGLNRYITRNPEIITTVSNFILSFFGKKKTKTEDAA
jgi:hypothetical protein